MAQLFLRKTNFNFAIWVTFDQGQRTAFAQGYVTKFDLGVKWVKVNPRS